MSNLKAMVEEASSRLTRQYYKFVEQELRSADERGYRALDVWHIVEYDGNKLKLTVRSRAVFFIDAPPPCEGSFERYDLETAALYLDDPQYPFPPPITPDPSAGG